MNPNIAKQRQKEQWKYSDGMSMEQAFNRLREIQQQKVAPNPAAITVLDPQANVNNLRQGIMLLPKKFAELKTLLLLRLEGWSYEKIANELGGRCSVDLVKQLEKTAIERVKEAVHKWQKGKFSGVPIIGG